LFRSSCSNPNLVIGKRVIRNKVVKKTKKTNKTENKENHTKKITKDKIKLKRKAKCNLDASYWMLLLLAGMYN
jgi:hypothetical protein